MALTDLEIRELRSRLEQYEKEYGTNKVTVGAFISSKGQIEDAIAQAATDIIAGIGGGGGGGCDLTTVETLLAGLRTDVQIADTNIVAANAATETAVNSANTAIVAANAATETAVNSANTAIVAANAATETAVNSANTAIVAANAATETAVDETKAAVQTADTNIVAAVNAAAADTVIRAGDSPSLDAFGRWRVSNPVTLFDGRSGYSENLLWSNQLISGTLASSQSTPTAQTLFTSTASTAGRRIRQSLKRFIYTPGKSQLILITFNFNTLVSGNKKKVGYFDDENGIFLQSDGTEISVNRRTSSSGSAVDTKVTQANWNLDTMDGLGPSGIIMDFTKTQIFFVDLEWLGVGRVRVGFVIDGKIYYVHEFNHANVETVVYMSTGNLPIRYEMEHSGTGGGSSLSCICATVMSEGGSEPIGSPGARFTGVVSGLLANTGHCLFALRLRSAQANSPIVRITGVEVLGTTANDYFAWYILRNPTLSAGSFSWSSVPETSLELALGSSTVRTTNFGSTIVTGGLGFSQAPISIPTGDDIQLETQADGTVIPLVFVVFPYTNMSGALSVRWRQFG